MNMKAINDDIADVISLLEIMELRLTTIYDKLQLNESKHFHKEYVYCIKSLVMELKQELGGGNFSVDYVLEKTRTLIECAASINYDGHK